MIDSGVIDEKNIENSKVSLVYGQMNEPPGARARVALTGLTQAGILEIRKVEMYYFLLIIYFVLLKLVQKFLLCLEEFLRQLVINQLFLLKWVICKKELLLQKMDQLPLFKQFMFPLMI